MRPAGRRRAAEHSVVGHGALRAGGQGGRVHEAARRPPAPGQSARLGEEGCTLTRSMKRRKHLEVACGRSARPNSETYGKLVVNVSVVEGKGRLRGGHTVRNASPCGTVAAVVARHSTASPQAAPAHGRQRGRGKNKCQSTAGLHCEVGHVRVDDGEW